MMKLVLKIYIKYLESIITYSLSKKQQTIWTYSKLSLTLKMISIMFEKLRTNKISYAMTYLKKTLHLVALMSLSAFIFIGCESKTEAPASEEVLEEVKTVEEEVPAGPTDPQIASIAVTANQVDIDYAKMAMPKIKDSEVKKFAETMAKDHQAVIDAAVALANKLGVTPEDNPTTQSLLQRKAKDLDMLNTATNFDKAYIDNEVDYHTFVIDAIKNILIPNAQNPELKALLESAVPNFEHHLQMAKEIQAKVK